MEEKRIEAIVEKQRKFFHKHETLPVEFRMRALMRIRDEIRKNKGAVAEALRKDLGKSSYESYMCETGIVLSEIRWLLTHIKRLSRDKCVPTPIAQYISRCYIKKSPYGVVLIMSPWNYPFLLTMQPLIEAIAAGNTVVLKPSAYSPATSALIKEMIENIFPEKYVAVVTGGREENSSLLEQHFDKIFFTGSQAVGRDVLRAASKYLTPAVLELGGKSPCIVDRTANLQMAARRIIWGKFLNCGQTCVAPDYVLADESIRDELIEEMKNQIKKQFGESPINNKNYGKIINEKHFDRICGLIGPDKVVIGGSSDREKLKIEPTVMKDVTWDDAVMGEEIFGPVLPILTFQDVDDIPELLEDKPKPLAFYVFSGDKDTTDRLMERCSFGGGCVNDVVIHLATGNMPFGGVGESGMGCYHGKDGFETFSHRKSIVNKREWPDLPMRYQPFSRINEMLVRMFLR